MIRRIWSAPMLSPTGLLLRAGLLALVYLALHLAGWREYTSILCGTSPTGNLADRHAALCGLIYVLLHFTVVVGCPILVLAAGLLALVNRGDGTSCDTPRETGKV
jgi:hypothetical protein